ncbi:MAG: glycine betaine/L-proline ABC transporter ATP-binding protein [Spirochaetia bacterium]|jgi:glycine betaine/proline transport system ATP-binding protein|nr:glycine betaine/L-proline ABC transporter ATP-binding protein [Spirochaetia bacterium]
MSEMEPIVSIKNLWKVFGQKPKDLSWEQMKSTKNDDELKKTGCVAALRDITMEIERGEFFVIMGLSGSGKSTLIRTLIRLVEPTKGSIVFAGSDVVKLNKKELIEFRRKKAAMVFQNYALLPHRTVLENAAYGLKIQGMKEKERLEKAETALETVGLKGWESYYPGNLSGGMQQRVGIARALATDPEILLMDEPFSGLDPLIRRQMQDELVELQDTVKKTIIFVTHDLHEALKLGSRIAIMKGGLVVQTGTPEEVVTNPADDYVKEFVKDASPAKIITAGLIMEDPDLLLYRWEGPKTARHLLKKSKKEYAFVVSKKRELLGVTTLNALDKVLKEGETEFGKSIDTDIARCTIDTTLEDLFPVATNTSYSVAVVDDKGRFLGEIRPRMILDAMFQDEEEEDV